MGETASVKFYDRYQQQICTERIYGEAPLRWMIETRLGRLTTKAIISRTLFSRFYGYLMDRPSSRERITPFIEHYQLDPAEFLDDPNSFASFNEFFYRKLKPGARPLDQTPGAILFPADGRHLAIPDLSAREDFFVKGQLFNLEAFVRDPALAKRYHGGTLVLSRLCPVDYHRYHFPSAGTPGSTREIPGPLFSVNPLALRRNLEILSTNKRVLTELKTENAGTILTVEIGATNVGSIRQTYQPNQPVEAGDEKGYFQFGGSAIATLFEPGAVQLGPDLLEQSSQNRELYAHIGAKMAMTS